MKFGREPHVRPGNNAKGKNPRGPSTIRSSAAFDQRCQKRFLLSIRLGVVPASPAENAPGSVRSPVLMNWIHARSSGSVLPRSGKGCQGRTRSRKRYKKKTAMSLQPKIIAFCCNWCSYAAADLAGTARMSYPESVRIIRVMCSGVVHPDLVIEALNMGADAVMILGCRLNECHYLDGNRKALARAEVIIELMEDLGYEKERFSLHWLSSSEPDKFVAAVTEVNVRIKKLSAMLY